MGGQLQAQRFYRRPCVGIGNAGLLQPKQLLGAAGGGGCLVGVLVGEGRSLYTGKIIGDALQQESVVQHGTAAAADGERGAGVGQTLQRDHRPGTAQLAGAAIEGIPCGAPYHAVHGKPRKPLVRPHRALSIRAKFAVNAYRRDAALVGAHEVEVKLQLPHRCAGRAGAQHTRVLAGAQGRGKQPVGDIVVHLVQLLPCGAPHYPVCRQPEVPLEPLHSRCRASAEFPVHRHVGKAGVHGAGDLEPELHQPHVLAAGTLPQGGAGVGVGGSIVGLDAAELVVYLGPGGAAHHAVHGQAVFALEGPHRCGGAAAEHAIHCHRGDGGIVLG